MMTQKEIMVELAKAIIEHNKYGQLSPITQKVINSIAEGEQ